MALPSWRAPFTPPPPSTPNEPLISISEIPKEPAERGPSCILSSSTPPTPRTEPPFPSDGDSLAFSAMAHEDHVLRRSVEIEDEVGLGLGLGVVIPSVWEEVVVGGGSGKAVEDCQFVGDGEPQENGETPLVVRRVREGEARSEISSIGSVSEDVVIRVAEAVDVRSRRVPEESREKVRKWIKGMERILNADGDGDCELVCFYGYTARNRRRAGSERGRFGSEGDAEGEAGDRGGSVLDTGEDGGSRGDGTGEVPVMPEEGEQGVRYPREMNCRKEKDEELALGSREATTQSRNKSVPHSIQIVEGGATGIYASQEVEEVDEKGEKDN